MVDGNATPLIQPALSTLPKEVSLAQILTFTTHLSCTYIFVDPVYWEKNMCSIEARIFEKPKEDPLSMPTNSMTVKSALFHYRAYSPRITVNSCMSRNGASADSLEPAQLPLSTCLNCGDLVFFVPSCWFGCFSFTLVRFSAILSYTRIYGIFNAG